MIQIGIAIIIVIIYYFALLIIVNVCSLPIHQNIRKSYVVLCLSSPSRIESIRNQRAINIHMTLGNQIFFHFFSINVIIVIRFVYVYVCLFFFSSSKINLSQPKRRLKYEINYLCVHQNVFLSHFHWKCAREVWDRFYFRGWRLKFLYTASFHE